MTIGSIGRISRYSGAAVAIMLITAITPIHAAEKGGLLVDISKSIVHRKDGPSQGSGTMSVDRTMSLKLAVKNNAMKDMPATTVEYTVLIQRWGFSESGNVKRHQGTKALEALAVSHSASLLLGEFHIGGHLHGASDRHADHLVAWKVVIPRDGEKLEFVSGQSFETLNQQAK